MSEVASDSGDKIAQIKELLGGLTNLETARLTKELEEEWGVSAAMPMAGAMMAMAPGAGEAFPNNGYSNHYNVRKSPVVAEIQHVRSRS